MSYLVFARKYRPQNFAEIIGQEHIVTTLKNAIKQGKIWHSYIFSGTRGTGKTTTARVLAKILNCLSPTQDIEPCNNCKNCIEISQGNCIDVIEIDAASNRGIDEIRTLRENVNFVPVNCKYKVYIIDEAHQITEHAFNAFLKTLEEPPPYIIFIMATTEFNKFPQTIVSRCQVFQFRPVPVEAIVQRLKYIVSQEVKNVKIDEKVLYLIAENSTGSVRDALSLLDQVVAFAEKGTITVDTIYKIFGATPKEIIEKYVELISSGKLDEVVSYIDYLYNTGVDFLQFSKELLEYFRSILYSKLNIKLKTSGYDVSQFKDKFSITKLITNIQLLLRLTEEIKRSEFPKVLFEIYSIKLTQEYVEIDTIVNLLDKLSSSPTSSQNYQQESSFDNTLANYQKDVQPTSRITDNSTNKEIDFVSLWDNLLEQLRIEKPLLFPLLVDAEVSFEKDSMTIFLQNKYVRTTVEKCVCDIKEYWKKLTGKEINIYCKVIEHPVKLTLEESSELNSAKKDVTTQISVEPVIIKKKKIIPPEIEKIRAMFSGEIVNQEEKE